MYKVSYVKGYEIIDSRGNPTVYCEISLSDGSKGCASVPSGASTGKYEAHELRDEDGRFGGKGVAKAVNNINDIIAPIITSTHFSSQSGFDSLLNETDGTDNKNRLGANALLACSLAFARACSKAHNEPLFRYIGGINAKTMPVPMMNVLNGGAHAKNNVDIQEFMIVPVGAECIHESVRIGSDVVRMLGKILDEKGLSCGVGDEGGFAPALPSDEEAIELVLEAVKKSGYENKVMISLDIASGEWYSDGVYRLTKRDKAYSREELMEYWSGIVNKYPIFSLEDPFAEDDIKGWQMITEKLGNKIRLVGDDLFVTNEKRLKNGIDKKCANSILIKPNQIGTLTETLNTINIAKKSGYSTIISHRSGETEDSFIADLSVGVNSGFIKTGAPVRSDRCSKYNRLLIIESELYNIPL